LSESGPATAALSYDPLGRLNQTVINGTTTQFLYSGPNLVAELNGSGAVLRRYVHGPGADQPFVWIDYTSGSPVLNWLHADRQGSVIATSNASGASYAYGPYGEPQAWGGSRFSYTGQIQLPELQLYYYKARVYDPIAGRFLQTDPIGYKDDLDLYAYVGDDPHNRADPSGQAEEDDADCSGGCRRTEFYKKQPDTFADQFQIGDEAHRVLAATAAMSDDGYSSNVSITDSGVKFDGRPDLIYNPNALIWELKPLNPPSVLAGLSQVWGYGVSTGFLYRPAATAPSFFTGNTLTARGVMATYTYEFLGHGVIGYTYEMNRGYAFSRAIGPMERTFSNAADNLRQLLPQGSSPGILPLPVPSPVW
jgi:RHS repeat-associated protein